jgi:hypothetical protein
MKNYYYLYWVDAISSIKANNHKRRDWKFSLFTYTIICNALNLWVVLLWLKYFNVLSFKVQINLFPGTILNSAIGFIIYFATPFILLNYFLIFYRDRYKKLIEIYPHRNGKFAMRYIFISVLLGFISMILYGVLR